MYINITLKVCMHIERVCPVLNMNHMFEFNYIKFSERIIHTVGIWS